MIICHFSGDGTGKVTKVPKLDSKNSLTRVRCSLIQRGRKWSLTSKKLFRQIRVGYIKFIFPIEEIFIFMLQNTGTDGTPSLSEDSSGLPWLQWYRGYGGGGPTPLKALMGELLSAYNTTVALLDSDACNQTRNCYPAQWYYDIIQVVLGRESLHGTSVP